MREIKFRAWDAKKKEMLEMFSDDIGPGFLMDFFCNAFEAQMPGENNVKIMQFTGLRDKNGKEIYEGDIMRVDETRWLIEPISVQERDGLNYGLCASPWGNGVNYLIDKSILVGEVIGNIYENPGFLNP